MSRAKTEPNAELQVPMEDVAQFVRQLSHDLRNHLNAAELQSAYINEVTEEPELKGEVQRLRAMVSEMGATLQRLTASLAPINLTAMPYEAAAFVEDLRAKIALQFPDEKGAIDWQVKLDKSAVLEADPQLLQQALLELFKNAFQHERGEGSMSAIAEVRENEFIFNLREPKIAAGASTQEWGRQPFCRVSHGQYGLGLHRAYSIVTAHGGRLEASYEGSVLVTTIALPLATVVE